jgi:hypothetical protein
MVRGKSELPARESRKYRKEWQKNHGHHRVADGNNVLSFEV